MVVDCWSRFLAFFTNLLRSVSALAAQCFPQEPDGLVNISIGNQFNQNGTRVIACRNSQIWRLPAAIFIIKRGFDVILVLKSRVKFLEWNLSESMVNDIILNRHSSAVIAGYCNRIWLQEMISLLNVKECWRVWKHLEGRRYPEELEDF